jgi:hypothetical protein
MKMLQQASDTSVQQATVFVSDSQTQIDLKVLHVVNGEHFSGAERVQSHLGRCLPKYGVAADFASVKPGKFAEMVIEKDGECANDQPLRSSCRMEDPRPRS